MAVATAKAPVATASIRPFRIETPEADLEELRSRIAATRWPTKELVEDRSAQNGIGCPCRRERCTGDPGGVK